MEVCRVVTGYLSLLITLMTWPVLRCEAQVIHPVDEFSFDYDSVSVRLTADSVMEGTLLAQDTTPRWLPATTLLMR